MQYAGVPAVPAVSYQPLPPERVLRLAPGYVTYTTTHVVATPAVTSYTRQAPAAYAVSVPQPVVEAQLAPTYYMAPVVASQRVQVMPPPLAGEEGAWQTAWDAAEGALAEQLPFAGDGLDQEPPPSDSQFVELLESLEARVDLMSQMQLTRAAIQQRASEVQELSRGVQEEAQYEYGQHQEEPYRTGPIESHVRAQFQDQRECITRLAGEVRDMRRKLLSLGSEGEMVDESGAPEDSGEQPGGTFLIDPAVHATRPAGLCCSLDDTQPVGAAWAAQSLAELAAPPPGAGKVPEPPAEPLSIRPFSLDACGVNLSISEDGYLAARMRGCRQSVAIGSGPLPAQNWGYYFEVEVQETVAGWVGGLGIGVTSTSPGSLRRVPDKAWRMPNSFIVGYWGCIFLDGKEHRTAWRSDSLCAGSRVGLLITGDGRGDLIVFVNGRPVVRAEGALLGDGTDSTATWEEPLYPVVDVFAATRVVVLSQFASPPPPPWQIDESLVRPSPPGSPGSMARSMCATSVVGSALLRP